MVEYYQDPSNVRKYLEMAEGYDGRELVHKLSTYLSPGLQVLEIGMGPGKDLDLHSDIYSAVGSDNSEIFLEYYIERNPEATLLNIDAVTLETDLQFDGIYSNKVLHHLTPEELEQSFKNQLKILTPSGIALHSFWKGHGTEYFSGMRTTSYESEDLSSLVPSEFSIVELSIYKEIDPDDSICLVLRAPE